jgi:hypothetical protein
MEDATVITLSLTAAEVRKALLYAESQRPKVPDDKASQDEKDTFHKQMDELHDQLEAKLRGLTMITGSVIMRISEGLVLLYKISEALDADMS